MKHIASVSWGKDSLAMLLMLIEKGHPLDEVVFFDTGLEFQAIYDTRDRVVPFVEGRGIKYTELRYKEPFEYMMFEKPVVMRGTNTIHKHGYSWCGGTCRWGTDRKQRTVDEYCGDALVYLGIAHDEWDRIPSNRKKGGVLPLVDWGIPSGEALVYCYQRGYFWPEEGHHLYALLDRVSCWCCQNNNLKELRNIWAYLPSYWERLKDFQSRTDRPYKGDNTVYDLERRFEMEASGETQCDEESKQDQAKKQQLSLL